MTIHVNKQHISYMYHNSIQFLKHQSKYIVIVDLNTHILCYHTKTMHAHNTM